MTLTTAFVLAFGTSALTLALLALLVHIPAIWARATASLDQNIDDLHHRHLHAMQAQHDAAIDAELHDMTNP